MFNADCRVGVVYLIMCKPTALLHATLYVLFFFVCTVCMLHYPVAFYYPSVRSCVSVTMNNRHGSCGFCPSFVTIIIHEHTAAGGGYQQSRNKLRLDAKTVTIEITLASTSDWRTTNANNITLNPLLAVTHLAPPSAPRYPGSGVLWLVIGSACPCVPSTGALSPLSVVSVI